MARDELLLLIVPLALIASLCAFVALADALGEQELQSFDEGTLRSLRDPADPGLLRWPTLANPARDVTALGSPIVLALVTTLVLIYLSIRKSWREALLVLVSVAGGGLLSQLLKRLFERPRPSLVPHLDHVLSYSFPSGHSMTSAVVYLTLGALLARLAHQRWLKLYFLLAAALLAVLVGTSRVFLGVHYPSDVVAGWSAALAWSSLCWCVTRYLQFRGKVEPDSHLALQQTSPTSASPS